MPGRPIIALVIASACWASANLFAKSSLAYLSPMTLLATQLFAATFVLWVALFMRGIQRPHQMRLIAIMGVLEPAIAYAAVNLGLTLTGASSASLIAGAETIFVVVLAWIFLRQRPRPRTFAAITLAVIGVAVISGSVSTTSQFTGNSLVMVGALAAAGYVVIASRVAPAADPLQVTGFQFLFGTLASLPLVGIQWSIDRQVIAESVPTQAWVAAVLAGVVGLALPFLLYNYAIAHVSAITAGVSLTLIPLFGFLGAAVVLREPVSQTQLLGASLVLAGLAAYAVQQDTTASSIQTTA